MQRRIKQLAGDITGKWAAGTIGPFFSGAEPNDEQLRIEWAESRNRERVPIWIALTDSGEVSSQAWAGDAVLRVDKYRHGGDVSMATMQLHWDIFCRVIDNYGDIGVCWRLARQLAHEHGKKVRLWLDDLNSLKPFCPTVDVLLTDQICLGIEIRHWTANAAVDRISEVIIEGFACELPPLYLQAMAQVSPKPCWVNLEYLTAEAWAEECHGMASPHPSLPLVKYFFFPGFSAVSGGLLREANLLGERDAEMANFAHDDALEISLFCYETAPVNQLLDLLAESPTAVRLHVAPGQPLAAVKAHLGGSGPWEYGKLIICPFDFLTQNDFDRLLWRCDINFIRGEDSFVRAQWAGKPFVWQIYRQEEAAHLIKLSAFLERYTTGLSPTTRNAVVDLHKAWNSDGDLRLSWDAFLLSKPEISEHNEQWTRQLANNPDLANALVKFCAAKV